MTRVVGFTGYSNSGKTTVISSLISIFSRRGLRVAAVKHASHGYDIDTPGKDSWQHYHAGADKVVVLGTDSLTMHQRLSARPPLKEILDSIDGMDLVLVEGFKKEVDPRILVYRPESQADSSYPPGRYIAVVSDMMLPIPVPGFRFDELEKLADFILTCPSA